MCSIDWSKVRPGDKVTVVAEVTDVHQTSFTLKMLDPRAQTVFWAPREAVIAHEPKAYVPKVGDVVTWGSGVTQWRIMAIGDGDVWLKCGDSDVVRALTKLENLRLA